MEKGLSTRKIVATLLALTLTLATLPSLGFSGLERAYASQTDQNLAEPSETIYFAVFPYYTGILQWAENLWFDFNNTVGIPLDTSLSAFDQHFQNADYSLLQWTSWDEYVMLLTVSYDAIGVDLAENHTDEICNQFQQAFNLNLSITDSWHDVDNATGYVTVYRRLGYIYLENTVQDISTIEELVKYKPSLGYGQLINTDFLNHWLSNPSKGGLFNLEYTLNRVDQNTLSWRFVIGLEPSEERILGNEAFVSVNFDEMLNHSGPITPSTEGTSKIQVDIQKTSTFSIGTYSMALESISPTYTSRQDDDSILVTYDLTNQSIDNVIASVAIAKVNSGTNSSVWTNAAIVAVLLGLTATGFVYVRRRRRLRKHVAQKKTAGQEAK
jgi:hypothetical protein